jgi:predicted ATPase/DNA-binding SARP family transcriptional activator
MQTVLEIHTFGGLRVHVGGNHLPPLEARTAEAMLVYLARERRPVPRDVLAEFLWPDRPLGSAKANLRTALHRVRRRLEPFVITDHGAVALRGTVWTDVHAFEAHLRAGRPGEALALYRGAFLEGFYLDASPAFEAWAADEQERLRQLAIAAHQDEVARRSASGDDAAALEQAYRLIRLDPLHEPAHRAVLRLLARAGRRVEALRHLETYRTRLRDEYDVEPDAATLVLADRIRDSGTEAPELHTLAAAPEAVARDAPGDATMRTGAPRRAGVATGFPAFAGAFIGRQVALNTALHRLAHPDCRWLTVVGPGGAGKTRLVTEAAHRVLEAFPDGVVFVPLAGVREPDHVLPTLAQLLDFDVQPGADLARQLASFLSAKRLLLVLDNLEHLVDAAPVVTGVLRSAPHVQVLATSRTRLHLSEEWLLPIVGLPGPDDAQRLFALHAARADPDFDPRDHVDAVAEICRQVEGFPLAIELAATWVNAVPCERIAAQLAHGSALLAAPRRQGPTRHRSIESVFAASWDHLPDDLRIVFARLAIFRGGFLPTDALRVAGAPHGLLLDLVDRSLVRVAPGGRLELHELARRYAADRLAERGETRDVARRHLHTYAELARNAARRLFGPDLREGAQWFKAEQHNIRAALAWGLDEAGEADACAEFMGNVAWFWRLSCTLDEARGWLDRALNPAHGLSKRSLATLSFHAAHFDWMRGEFALAEPALRASLERWELLGDEGRLGAARTRISLGMTYWALGDLERAGVAFTQAGRAFEELDAPWWCALTDGWQAKLADAAGDAPAAQAAVDTCLVRFDRLGNEWGSGLFVGTAAELHFRRGDVAGARELARKSVSLLERIGFKHALGHMYHLLARIARAENDVSQAERYFDRAYHAYCELGHQAGASAVTQDRSSRVDA